MDGGDFYILCVVCHLGFPLLCRDLLGVRCGEYEFTRGVCEKIMGCVSGIKFQDRRDVAPRGVVDRLRCYDMY